MRMGTCLRCVSRYTCVMSVQTIHMTDENRQALYGCSAFDVLARSHSHERMTESSTYIAVAAVQKEGDTHRIACTHKRLHRCTSYTRIHRHACGDVA